LKRNTFIKYLGLTAISTLVVPLISHDSILLANTNTQQTPWNAKDKLQWQKLLRFAKAYIKRKPTKGLFVWKNKFIALRTLQQMPADVFLMQNNYNSNLVKKRALDMCNNKSTKVLSADKMLIKIAASKN
jgi:hypothetical protein